jgi:hypothetical protein
LEQEEAEEDGYAVFRTNLVDFVCHSAYKINAETPPPKWARNATCGGIPMIKQSNKFKKLV